ncbi:MULTISPECIES: PAS domain S-box protein [unclassified Coleofasciculus]|uniref:PAS domain S-box protein n=1 Tax=unclassified Coleofasciculus TaxID=2692782 RepID=UPI00187EF525|nr:MULTISPECIES: PAS domain S-box protein [unclassified Coleofasciculus]MBE9126747.1 PAS domain S-box protein [Coleofasciculus sp. LEGE 07081]MBE9150118.1 PAS domain S-box protein [Coleofasciculus sp. LEGE 07092]
MAAQLQQYLTRLQASNKSLAESESKLNQILEAIPVGISVHDRTGKLIYANDKSRELLGIEALPDAETEQLAVAYQVYQAGGEQLYPVEAMPVVRALQGEKAWVDDMEIHLPEQTIPLEVYGTPLLDETGEMVAAIAVFFDITERKQTERILADYNRTLEAQVAERTETLSRREALLNESQRIAKMGSWSWNLESDERWWSHEMYRIIGLHPEEYPIPPDVETVNQSVHPEDRERVNQITQQAIEQGISYDIEFRFLRPDGRINYAFSRGLVERNSEGQITHFWGITQDISARKTAELALQQQKSILQTIVDNIPVMLCFYKADVEVQLINKAFRRTLGWSLAEIKTLDIMAECYPDPDYRASVLEFMTRADSTWQDFQLRTRTGQWLETTWANVRLPDGSTIGIGQDISDRKRIEQALQRYERIVCATTDAVALVDRNSIYQIVNQTYLTWHNKREDEIIGHSVAEVLGADLFEHLIKERLDRALAGEAVNYQMKVELAIGERFVSVHYSPYFETDRTISGVVVSVRDITQLKQATEAAEAAKQIKSTAQGQAPAIIAVSASVVRLNIVMAEDTNFDDFIRKPFREVEIFEAMSKHIGVRFVYEESNELANIPSTEVTADNVDDLAKLPADLVANLYQATLEGDFQLMLTLIEEIRAENDSLATVLAALANNFQFQKLLDLLESLNA